MKILTPGLSRNDVGGGGSFLKNLQKAIIPLGHHLVEQGDYDILLIAGASLCDRNDFLGAKGNNKPIILRVDNILEDCKNRNGGMSKMREYAEGATVIVYQSEWAKRLLKPYCGDGMVVYNGVDTDIFHGRTEPKNWEGLRVFYSKFSRNEVKRVHEAQYWWREYCLDKSNGTLVLVGRFADEYTKINHPFEFHNNEEYEYKGVVMNQHILADIMRTCDVAFLPYYADACSNTVLEAQACGLPVIYQPYGGTKEIIEWGTPIDYNLSAAEMVDKAMQSIHSKSNLGQFKDKFGLETMGQKYASLFQTILLPQHDI